MHQWREQPGRASDCLPGGSNPCLARAYSYWAAALCETTTAKPSVSMSLISSWKLHKFCKSFRTKNIIKHLPRSNVLHLNQYVVPMDGPMSMFYSKNKQYQSRCTIFFLLLSRIHLFFTPPTQAKTTLQVSKQTTPACTTNSGPDGPLLHVSLLGIWL